MIRRTSSRETWRHDSRMRPHFGHFTIHWSRSSLPTLVPPRHPADRGRTGVRRRDSRSYLNIAGASGKASEFRNPGGVIGGISANRAFGSDLGRPVRGLESRGPLRLRALKGISGAFAPRGRRYWSRPLRFSPPPAPPDWIVRAPRGDATTAGAPPPARAL